MNEEFDFISQRQFAKRIGKSRFWVGEQVRAKRLTCKRGKISLSQGLEEVLEIPGFDMTKEELEQLQKEINEQSIKISGISEDDVIKRYNLARMKERMNIARLKELQLLEKSGYVVNINEALKIIEETGAIVREKLLSISDRCAPLMENRTQGEILEIFLTEIDDVLKSFDEAEIKIHGLAER